MYVFPSSTATKTVQAFLMFCTLGKYPFHIIILDSLTLITSYLAKNKNDQVPGNHFMYLEIRCAVTQFAVSFLSLTLKCRHI